MLRSALFVFCVAATLLSCQKTEEHPFSFYVDSQDTFRVRNDATTELTVKVVTEDGQPQEVYLSFMNLPEGVKVERLTILPDGMDTFKFQVSKAPLGTFPVKIAASSEATGNILYEKWLVISK